MHQICGILRFVLFFVCILCSSPAARLIAEERSPVNQVFQFAHSAERVYPGVQLKKASTVYLWIPETCSKLRGLVLMGNNVPEHMLAGHSKIREACRQNDLGLVWGVPTFWHFPKEMKGRDDEQASFLQTLLDGLAEKSGYEEVATVPWIPVGESGHLLMVCGLVNARPERCVAAICVKNPHSPENKTVPMLWTLGTAQEWGQKDKDIRQEWNAAGPGFRQWVGTRGDWPLSILVEAGSGHFACTDEMVEYFAKYITAACKARLATDGRLKPVDVEAGFLANLPLPGVTDLDVIPYAGSSPAQRQRAWFFTKELAEDAQKIATTDWQAKSALLGFTAGAGCEVKPFSFNSVSEILVTTDSEFAVSAAPLETIPEGFVGAGESLSMGSGKANVEWICGPFAPAGNDRFRIALDRTWKTGAASYLIGRMPAAEGVRASFQPAAVKLNENTEGTSQTITFEKIPDVRAGSPPIPLSAASDSGLPVEFTVLSGPAVIEKGHLVLTQIPPRTKFPVAVTVAAWQWGRPSEPKVKTTPLVSQTFLVTN